MQRSIISAWHADASEKFDFSRGEVCIEVKASELQHRIHEFSLGQLQPTGVTQIYVASLLLRKSGGGVGVLDLADRIASKFTSQPELTEKLWVNVAQSMGQDFNALADVRFNEQYALANLRYVLVDAVPSIRIPLPAEIIDVRLKVDITKVAETHDASRNIVEALFSND